MTPAEIEALIVAHLPGATVRVTSTDNVHFEAVVVCEAFAGKRPIQRHQLVYAAIGGRMGGDIHALSMRTLTPVEAARDATGGAGPR
ncbi:MAG: BolA/IbaG family iron-sulfur metabolism protein [Gammaproteobacteria bacterium]|nr:BolA/IbaG family iron-sulfur metabolism protein [Gammaproteobacteria bacterium]